MPLITSLAQLADTPWGFQVCVWIGLVAVVGALVVGVAAVIWISFGEWKEYRDAENQDKCVRCGYDLRGAPSGGGSECPECGAASGGREVKA